MSETAKPSVADESKEIDFDAEELEAVEISDRALEADDKATANSRRAAKKLAKKLRSPEDKKRLKRRNMLIGIGAGLGVILLLLAIPFTRWPILNLVGFRSNLQLTITQQGSNRTVAKASVKLENGLVGETNKFGVVTFKQARLGKHSVTVQKAGFGSKTLTVTNSLGTTKTQIPLKVIGIKLDIDVKDWLSGSLIQGATVSYGQSSAQSDRSGRASLIIPPTDADTVNVTIKAPNYLTKTVNTELNVESREITIVSSQKNYFISKRDGKFDIFSSNLDGSDQRKIIEATGKEDESLLQFSINRNNKQAVLVSNRDGKTVNNKVIAGIYQIDLENATIKKVDEGSDVQLLDWTDNTMVYTKSVTELNYDDPAQARIVSLNFATNKLAELAKANYFNLSLVAQNKVFYLPADAYRPIENAVLTSLDINSGARKTYLTDKTINYAVRASYNTLELQDANGTSFELQIPAGTTKAIDRKPGAALAISLSANNQQALWSDKRDGQGALIMRNLKTNEEKVVTKAGGLTSPVRFISDNLAVVRVATSQETADYVVSLSGGKLAKVVDVSNVGVVRASNL